MMVPNRGDLSFIFLLRTRLGEGESCLGYGSVPAARPLLFTMLAVAEVHRLVMGKILALGAEPHNPVLMQIFE